MAQGVKVTTVGGNNQAVMYMNPTRPPFDDLNVRQAISYAFPYDEILEGVYFGAASRGGGGPIPSTTPTFDPDAPFYSQDMDKARELLAASGYPRWIQHPALHRCNLGFRSRAGHSGAG